MTTLDEDEKDDPGWEYHRRFKKPSDESPVSQILSQPQTLSPQERNLVLSNFVAEH
jgi:hypothetical protein